MARTPARPKSTPSAARGGSARLEALAATRASARDRLERGAGFVASLDDHAIVEHLLADAPEVLGSWPDRAPGCRST